MGCKHCIIYLILAWGRLNVPIEGVEQVIYADAPLADGSQDDLLRSERRVSCQWWTGVSPPL